MLDISTTFSLHFGQVKDPRIKRKKDYPLIEILFLVTNSTISGYENFSQIADWGQQKLDWLRNYFPYKNGIPSHDTIGRVMSLLEPTQFEQAFNTWAKTAFEALHEQLKGQQIAIDGKIIRHSATKQQQQTPHEKGGKSPAGIVEAYWVEDGNCLSVCSFGKAQHKSSEIPAIKNLIENIVITNSVVTIDAIGCQTEITKQITDCNADYVVGLKKNQLTLYNYAQDLKESQSIVSSYTSLDKAHGRVEERRYTVFEILDTDLLEKWHGAKTIIVVDRTTQIVGTTESRYQQSYYLSSLNTNAAHQGGYVRGHWGIENSLHWLLDVCFSEDLCRQRLKNVASNMGVIRRYCLNLIKAHPQKCSNKSKQMRCAISDEFRIQVLTKNY